jgi:hypothetical protein
MNCKTYQSKPPANEDSTAGAINFAHAVMNFSAFDFLSNRKID